MLSATQIWVVHAVNAMVTDGLNRDRIEPPQPIVYLQLIHPPVVLALFKCGLVRACETLRENALSI